MKSLIQLYHKKPNFPQHFPVKTANQQFVFQFSFGNQPKLICQAGEGFHTKNNYKILFFLTKISWNCRVTVNDSQDEQSIHIWNDCVKCLRDPKSCNQIHNWVLESSQIKTMTLNKRDERCLFLYVHSDDFQMYFPSEIWRQAFYDKVRDLTADQDGMIKDLESAGLFTFTQFVYICWVCLYLLSLFTFQLTMSQ